VTSSAHGWDAQLQTSPQPPSRSAERSFSATIGVSVNTVQSFPTNPNSTIGGSSEASAASDLSLVLLTAGLQRPGFLKIDWEVNGGPPYDGSYDANLTVGSLSLTRPFGNFCCSPLFPFDLGQAFSFEMNVSQLAYAVFQDGVSGGFNNASVTLRFYETDRSTPVGIEETTVLPTAVPEPRFLVILGVAGSWLFSKHRRGFGDANRI
jgi:hypothetical protein